MRINYTGRQVELTPAQVRKINAQFATIGKLLDGKDQREAHVVVSHERHLHRAEITVNYQNHPLVSIESDPELFVAIHGAIQKLEKQAIKVRAKWRDTKRSPREAPEAQPVSGRGAEPQTAREVFRVNHKGRKPMTLDEALLEMEGGRNYLVYVDAVSNQVCMLVRRPDGNFDLVEA
jgi:putative sigma-54 modulation protein